MAYGTVSAKKVKCDVQALVSDLRKKGVGRVEPRLSCHGDTPQHLHACIIGYQFIRDNAAIGVLDFNREHFYVCNTLERDRQRKAKVSKPGFRKFDQFAEIR